MMVTMAEKIGYHVRFRTRSIHGWMELKKPGQLSTIKGGQSLGRVIHVKNAVVTDKKSYTQEEIEMIHKEAIALGIDNEERINNGAIEPGKLELLIKRRKHAIEEERRLIEEIGKQNSKDS